MEAKQVKGEKVPVVEFDLYGFLSVYSRVVLQAQLQRSLDSSVSVQPRALIGRRSRKEVAAAAAAVGAGMDSGGQGGSPLSEQDSGILDVEDEEEDDEVRKLQPHTETHGRIEAAVDLLMV